MGNSGMQANRHIQTTTNLGMEPMILEQLRANNSVGNNWETFSWKNDPLISHIVIKIAFEYMISMLWAMVTC